MWLKVDSSGQEEVLQAINLQCCLKSFLYAVIGLGDFYAWMIRNKAVAAVQEVYPAGDAIWQDDPASIHRTQAALDACSAFAERIPHNVQAAKLSDVWPIEQVFMAGLSP